MEQSDLTEALNREGFFFQKYCAEKIKESGWSVETEEYPISKDESFDIKATLVLFETALHIVAVECKRSDPKRKRWAFFRQEPSTAETQKFVIQTHNLTSTKGGFLKRGFVMRGVYEGLNEEKLGFPCCHTVGLEIFKEDEKDKRDWKANPQAVYSACLTVAKGINHLFDSEAQRTLNTLRIGEKRLQEWKEKLRMPYFLGGTLVPAVITSAPILSVTSDPNDMDIETFRVPHEKAHYQDKEWLVYEFPLPLELQLESRDFFTTVGESRYAKMHIFIVNGKHVKRFFECLGEAIKTRSKKSYRALAVEYQEFYKGKK